MTNTTSKSASNSPRRMARETKPDLALTPESPSKPASVLASAGAGVTPSKPPAAPAEKKQTKVALVLELLARPQGATLDQLVEATGWLPHTTRAALTGLKKKGHTIERRKVDEHTTYFRA